MTATKRNSAGVAAGHGETAHAAVQILEQGGNAFDAAIGGFLAAAVSEPVLASLGGGGFLVARTLDGRIETFDFFTATPGTCPAKDDVDFHPIVADFGNAQQEFHIGLGSVAVPGAVAGVFAVHDALGRMPIAEIAQPAIDLASRGLRVNAFQAYLLDVVGPIYRSTPSARAGFCRSDGPDASLIQEGDVFKLPDYADALAALVREGPDLFYRGDIAAKIAALPGCTVGRQDLEAYDVVRRETVETMFRGARVHINPPPAIGGALISLALKYLEANLGGNVTWGDEEHLMTLAAAMRFANDARKSSAIDLDAEAGAEVLAGIDAFPPAYRGTTHISVADSDGNLAALTVSNGEGCGHIVPGTGIMLNNMLGEEDLNAAGFFNWRPGIRMSSMMSPGMMRTADGAWTAFGSGGSNRIRSAITQIILNMGGFGLSLADAIIAPRLHLEAGKLSLEDGVEDGILDRLRSDAAADIHVWPERNMFFGGVHAVRIGADGGIDGAGDPRRDGIFVPL